MTEQRPAYSTSKRAMWISGACAWLAIFAVIAGALRGSAESVAIASIVVPSMVMMIVALLGVHRAFGSLDMRTMAGAVRSPRPRREREPRTEEEPA